MASKFAENIYWKCDSLHEATLKCLCDHNKVILKVA